jgi:hypothetical protein
MTSDEKLDALREILTDLEYEAMDVGVREYAKSISQRLCGRYEVRGATNHDEWTQRWDGEYR